MVSPQDSRTDVGEVVQTSHRSLCVKVQQEAASVCVPGSGPTSVGDGCSHDSRVNLLAYAFPLFSILRRVIRKTRVEETSLFLVATIWVSKPKGLSASVV